MSVRVNPWLNPKDRAIIMRGIKVAAGKRKKSERPEQAIQATVVRHLDQRGIKGLVYFHVPNGGKRYGAEGGIFKGQGVKAGVPDIILIHGGNIYALELKAKGRKPTVLQHLFHDRLRAAGAVVAVADGLDAAVRQLEAWRLLRGTVQAGKERAA